MPSSGVLKGIKHYTFATNIHKPWHDANSAKYAEFYSVEDITKAIRRGDLIPRSRLEKELKMIEEQIAKLWEEEFERPRALWQSQKIALEYLLRGEPKP